MDEKNKEQQQEVTADKYSVAVAKKDVSKLPVDKVANSAVNSLSRINLLDAGQVERAKDIMLQLARSKKGGIASVEDGLAVLMRAQDLNLPFSTCLEHIHVINGKTGVDIHIIKSLLSKAGLTWECTKDYSPLYEYTDGFNVYVEDKLPDYCIKCLNRKDAEAKQAKVENGETIYVYPTLYFKDFNGNIYKSYQWNQNLAVAMTPAHATELAKQGKVPVFRIPNQPIDYVTEYDICRIVNGKEVHSVGHFSFSEAQSAEMFEKDTYKKYPRILIGHRAFTYAARDIASDILFGVYETTELKIVAGHELNDADIIDIEAQEVKD